MKKGMMTIVMFLTLYTFGEVSSNFTFSSNYFWRGMTQTMDSPAYSGGFDYSHESGFYAGTWGSNVSFGGAGPMHACELARELDIPKVFIPARPGLTNALGCLVADLRQDFTQTLNISLEETNIKNLHSILEKFKSDGVSLIKKQKVEIEKFYLEFSLDMQFLGQTHIIKIPLKDAKPSKNFINKVFENIYFKRFKVGKMVHW